MHIVTKILIVFASVLAILLAALVIPLAANSDAIATQFKNEQNAKIAAQTLAQDAQRAANDVAAKHATEKAALDASLLAEKKRVEALQTERADLIAAKKTAEAQLDSARANAASLLVTAETQAALGKNLKDELDAARKAQVDLAKQFAEVMERLNESERLRQVGDQTVRSLKEQLEEMKLAMEQAKSGGAAVAGGPRGFESSGPAVQGRVIKVMKGPNGDDLATINLGSTSGLKPNMRLTVVRDGYVADVVLISVDMNESVGRVNTLGRPVTVQAEDVVITRLN